MAAIPDHIIEQIREETDIVEVIGSHVGLKRSGKNFKGLCPFHDEKSPSFYVDPVRKSFKCFGCGVWGDAFSFVQKIEGVGFLSAVQTLGARVGVAMPNQSKGDVRRAEVREREREQAYRVNAAAAEVYRTILLSEADGEAGRVYQRERGIDEETSEAFRVGYAPAPEEAGWDTLVRALQKRDLSLDVAKNLGLIAASNRGGSYYDRFRGRLMFPIIQPGGRVLGFSGRVLPRFAETESGDKAPKYVNSPESVLYKKSKTLFGLHSAGSVMRKAERGILVEGQIDVVSMHQRGYRETVAPLGTALTKHQCELLARFTNQIILCFDGDRAGAKAAYAAMPLLLEVGMDVRVAALPEGEDPDSIDPEHLDNLLRAPGSGLEWLMRRMVAKGARQSIDAKARALRALVPLLRCVKGRDARGDYCNLAAEMLDLPPRRVWSAVGGDLALALGGGGGRGERGEGGRGRGSKRGRATGGKRGDRRGGGDRNRNYRGSKSKPRGASFKQARPAGDRSWGAAPHRAPQPAERSFEHGPHAAGPSGGPPNWPEPPLDMQFDAGAPAEGSAPWAPPPDMPNGEATAGAGFGDEPDVGFEPPGEASPFEAGASAGPPPANAQTMPQSPRRASPSPREGSKPPPSPSQFSGGVPHSAAMRSVLPLPSGQASVTALLVDRPELARNAERNGVLDHVTDQRLQPILARVIQAALDGETMPSEGELLDLVDPVHHRMLHDQLFGHRFLEDEDPQARLDGGLQICRRDRLEGELHSLEHQIAEARATGRLDVVRELMVKRMATRSALAELVQPRR